MGEQCTGRALVAVAVRAPAVRVAVLDICLGACESNLKTKKTVPVHGVSSGMGRGPEKRLLGSCLLLFFPKNFIIQRLLRWSSH